MLIYPINHIVSLPLTNQFDSPQEIVPAVINTGDDADDTAYTDSPVTDILSVHTSSTDDIFTTPSNTDTFPISTELPRTSPAPVCLTDRCIPNCYDTRQP